MCAHVIKRGIWNIYPILKLIWRLDIKNAWLKVTLISGLWNISVYLDINSLISSSDIEILVFCCVHEIMTI